MPRYDRVHPAVPWHSGLLILRSTDDPLIDAQLRPQRGGELLSLSFFKEERVQCMIKSFLIFYNTHEFYITYKKRAEQKKERSFQAVTTYPPACAGSAESAGTQQAVSSTIVINPLLLKFL
jgi:hypothetical protein